MDLTTMTQTAFAALAVDGKLEAIVKARVEKCVEEAIKDATGYNSDFSNGLKAYVKESLPMDFQNVNLAEYNGELLKMIKAKLDGNLQVWIDKTIGNQLEELLVQPPGEITVSELVEMCRKEMSADEERDFRPEIKESSGSTAGYWTLEIGKRGEGYRLAVTPKGEVYSVSIPYHGDITKRLFTSRGHGVDRVLWRLYACKTKLIRDGDYE